MRRPFAPRRIFRRPPGATLAAPAALLAAGALALLVSALCVTHETESDLWWHLASGDLIRQTGSVPRADPFSYTVPGRPWVDIHWLFQVVLSFLYQHGGAAALVALRTVLILALFGLLYARGRRRAGPNLVIAVLLVAVLACQERFLTRPEIVSWFLLAATLAGIDRALAAATARARRVILWAGLPLMQILWANVQGLFMLGPAMLTLALAAAALEARRRRDGIDRALDVLVSLALASAASLLNPYGAMAMRLPIDQLLGHLGGRTLLSRTIAEFRPPLTSHLVTPSIVAFGALMVLALLTLLAAAPRVAAFDWLAAAATLYLALKARRNIPIFTIAVVPIVIRSASNALFLDWGSEILALWPAFAARLRVIRRRAAIALSIALAATSLAITWSAVTDRFFLHPPTERWWGIGEIPYYFPEESARFVAGSGIPAQVFHSLASGGYLIHAWKGDRRVFIDGRNDPYLGGVLESYVKAIADPDAFEEVVRRYQITAVLWPHQQAIGAKPLLSYLARGGGWALVHLDAGAAVYLRSDLPLPRLRAAAPPGAGGDRQAVYDGLVRELEARPFAGPPIREIALAEYFSVTDDPKGAEFFYRRAFARLPEESAVVWHDYALCLARLGRRDEARAAVERALTIDPGSLPAMATLGAMLVDDGRLEEARKLLETAYRKGERGPALMRSRARLFDREGDPRGAVAAYQEALQFSPGNPALLREVASFYERHDQGEVALSFYQRAAESDPDDSLTSRAFAALLSSLGRPLAALDVARDAARRAGARLQAGRTGEAMEADRRMILLAARLEIGAGDRRRAAAWIDLLRRAGVLREEDLRSDPGLRSLSDSG